MEAAVGIGEMACGTGKVVEKNAVRWKMP